MIVQCVECEVAVEAVDRENPVESSSSTLEKLCRCNMDALEKIINEYVDIIPNTITATLGEIDLEAALLQAFGIGVLMGRDNLSMEQAHTSFCLRVGKERRMRTHPDG